MNVLQLLLIFVLLFTYNTQAQKDSVYIEFVSPNTSSGMNSIPIANGVYSMNRKSKSRTILGMSQRDMLLINPKRLIYNDSLITRSLHEEMNRFGRFQYPKNFYREITEKAYFNLLEKARLSNDSTLSVPELREIAGLKFQDISEEDKRRKALLYDWEEVERVRKSDSIINVKRRRLLLDPIRTPVKKLPSLDTTPIPDPKYFLKTDYFKAYPNALDSINKSHRSVRSEKIQVLVDQFLEPFFISKYEVTNGEYQEFLEFVKDSVVLYSAYYNAKNDSLRMSLLDCSQKIRDTLPPYLYEYNATTYGLKNPFGSRVALLKHADWSENLDFLFTSTEGPEYYERTNFKPQYVRFWSHGLGYNQIVVLNENALQEISDCLSTDKIVNYFEDPEFKNYPVVGISYEQAIAYSVWKQQQLSKKYRLLGFNVKVSIPTLAEFELAAKSTVPKEINAFILDQYNKNYIVSEFSCETDQYLRPVQEFSVKNPFKKSDLSDYKFQRWFDFNKTDKIQYLNGNVSEYCSSAVTFDQMTKNNGGAFQAGNLFLIKMTLGSNYKYDLYHKNGLQTNSIFYKRFLREGQSNSTTGFRLVYRFVPIKKEDKP